MSPHHSPRARRHSGRRWPAVTAMLVTLMALAALVFGITGAAAAAPATDCAGPVAGRHIYDCAGLLTPAEITTLEGRAAAVERAGAPTVVYLQAKDATAAETYQDAGDLMNRWNVQSAPDARDGFVMLLNLQPGNLRHGQVILFSGAKHQNDGSLPSTELTRIYSDVMLPLLRTGDTAGGIGAGLDAVAADLRNGAPVVRQAPPASPGLTALARFGRVPYNVLALLFLLGLAVLAFWRLRIDPAHHNAALLQARRAQAGDAAGLGVSRPPDALAPALVGALVSGRVRDAQIEATILDFARRGLVAFEPIDATNVQLRLHGQGMADHGFGLDEFERAVWHCLRAEANQEDVVTAAHLPAVRMRWQTPKQALRDELVARGWYLRHTPIKRPLLHIMGTSGVLLALLGFLVAVAASETAPLLGMVLLGVGAGVAYKLGSAVPDTTDPGAQAAAPWRAYLAEVKAAHGAQYLDDALPYLIAAGMESDVADRLRTASATGYSPAWFRPHADHRVASVGFYPYWTTFHSCMYPVASGGSGGGSFSAGGFAGGGAAGGGGGGGGGF